MENNRNIVLCKDLFELAVQSEAKSFFLNKI